MVKEVQFGQALFQALVQLLSSEDRKLFVQAALALRAWYRHTVLVDKPEMVEPVTANRFGVYGGAHIIKKPGGAVACYRTEAEGQLTESYVELSKVGNWLASQARVRIEEDYLAKAKQFVAQQAESGAQADELSSQLDDVHRYVTTELQVPWWRRKCTLADDSRVLGKLVWDAGFLDPVVFGLAVRVFGFRFNAWGYSACATQRDELSLRVAEAPNQVAWLVNPETGRLRTHSTVWKDQKDEFLAAGGTAQGWRWLCQQGAAWFHASRVDPAMTRVISKLAQLQLGRIPFHRGFVASLREKDDRFYLVYKAAVLANRKRKLKVVDFKDYVLIFDYLANEPTAQVTGATWASLMRKQQAWHVVAAREAAERRKASSTCLGWTPLVRSRTNGDLEALSLDTSDELWEEGDLMRHCVGTYDDACYRNQSRIYSIRRGGERVATLELRLAFGKWTIGQLYGCGNSSMKDTKVVRLAQDVLRACKSVNLTTLAAGTVIRAPQDAPPAPSAERLLLAEGQQELAAEVDWELLPF